MYAAPVEQPRVINYSGKTKQKYLLKAVHSLLQCVITSCFVFFQWKEAAAVLGPSDSTKERVSRKSVFSARTTASTEAICLLGNTGEMNFI